MKTVWLIGCCGWFLLIGLAPGLVMAQGPAAKPTPPPADTARLRQLLELAQREKTTPQALSSFQEALRLARQLHHQRGEGRALLGLGAYYRFRSAFTPALRYNQKARNTFHQLGDTLNEVKSLRESAAITLNQGEYAQAMAYTLEGLRLAKASRDRRALAIIYNELGGTYTAIGEYAKARQYLQRGVQLALQSGEIGTAGFCQSGLGRLAELQQRWEEALRHFEQATMLAQQAGNARGVAVSQLRRADMLERLGRYAQAFALGHQSLQLLRQMDDVGSLPPLLVVLARAHLHTGRPDSAHFYGQAALQASQRTGRKQVSRDASEVLAQASARRGRFADAYRYHQLFTAYQDSLTSQDLIRRTAGLQYQYELDQQQAQIRLLRRNAELSRERAQHQRLLLGGSLLALAVVGGLSGLLLRNNRLKQQANALLAQQKAEVQAQRDQTTLALTELKATQAQLIQKEKMASLGELTAGIAHEIQNPLNFVTNFSDLSADLCQELQTEIRTGHPDDVTALTQELQQNLQKIAHHGGRASNIVRSMLEHARPSTGARQPTDLNALCEEYLRLTYQSVRAKDPSFTATLTSDLAPDLGQVKLVPQDMGRVLLNVFTNAFYALQQRSRGAGEGYQPQVTVQTCRQQGQVQVRVCDNGPGMSEAVQAKVFQPFFTTKPPGEGTGLGLSLSYDIVTKGHGGSLSVQSRVGEGTQVLLCLPLEN